MFHINKMIGRVNFKNFVSRQQNKRRFTTDIVEKEKEDRQKIIDATIGFYCGLLVASKSIYDDIIKNNSEEKRTGLYTLSLTLTSAIGSMFGLLFGVHTIPLTITVFLADAFDIYTQNKNKVEKDPYKKI